MAESDLLLANAGRYAASFAGAGAPSAPRLGVAVVTCMDARLDVYALLGLRLGDAHVIRNAGGLVTDDVVRSLAVSQRVLATREVVLIHHLGCGMRGLDEEAFREELRRDAGRSPEWAVGSLPGPLEGVRGELARLRGCPYLVDDTKVRGFLYDEATGGLEEA